MKLAGSYVALATPFSRDGSIDEAAFRALIRRQLKSGTSGLVPCGSTGEAATLTHEEYRRLISISVEEAGRLPVIAGVGANATAKAIELSQEAQALGANAILLLAPYYNKPTQDGLFAHFRAVARGVDVPIIVYNIPGRTAVNILPQTLVKMAKACPNIIAVKEASGSVEQVSEIISLAPKNFTVLSGDDNLTLPMMAVGAKGVVSVVANIAPRQTAALCAAALSGDYIRARGIHLKMFPLVKALFLETNPIPVKAALCLMGLSSPIMRLPLTEASLAAKAALKAELKAFGPI